MAKNRIIQDGLKYILFSEIYHKFPEGKGQRKALALLEAAITCFARKGFEHVTMEMIAREAGVTRPLLKHYFRDLNDIHLISIKYIRLLFQKMAIDHMAKGTSISQSLNLYVEACFLWVENHKTHARVWLAYLSLCMSHKNHRALNTIAVETGEERIMALLEKGKSTGEFHFSNALDAAKTIQTLVTGALITLACENLSDTKAYLKIIQEGCLRVVRSPNSTPPFQR